MLGLHTIGAVVDTMTNILANTPPANRIISLCQSTLNDNIVLVGFD
jgi:hypothetical protein